MNASRNEIRTGLLVVLTFAVLIAVLLFLGTPGIFRKLHTYRIYFDNAAGIKPGADVMVAGRKAGQVRRIYAPMPENSRPAPKYECLIEVRVAASACVYNKVRVQMVQLRPLGDSMIDFSNGEESSGLARDGAHFIGERQYGLSDVVPQVLERLDPVLKKTTETLTSLQQTSQHLSTLTADGADLPLALAEFRKLGTQLNALSGSGGPLRMALTNIEELTCSDGPLATTLWNAARITGSKDIAAALGNFRQASMKLNQTVRDISPELNATGRNLEQASDTVKHQPWRLIWPATKSYPNEGRVPPAKAVPKKVSQRKP